MPPKSVVIHVQLLDEGTFVARPTEAVAVGGGLYRLLPTPDYDPAIETWEFPPGALVRVKSRTDENGKYFMAVKA